jgi:uncharacterized protein YecE (DUF72 family)
VASRRGRRAGKRLSPRRTTGGAEVHIGTSGWHYDHWVGPFYPSGTRPADFLDYYARHFRTVELNNTFYRLPTPEAVAAWRDGSPRNFLFAAKGSRFLTHMKKLKDPEVGLGRYFERITLLGSKLGPIVFQLPPGWQRDLDRLEAFLNALPARRRYAFEFRDESWFGRDTNTLLARHNAALCFYELSGREAPIELTADFTYIRLHGPDGPYRGSYSDKTLADWARRIRRWRAEGIATYCYFDNDDRGYAPQNALTLARMVDDGD